MVKFIKNIALFWLYTAILTFIIIAGYKYNTGVTLKELPAPNLTPSYSFNDKMRFARTKKADIITVGSSMSLDNLSSDVIINNFNTRSYLNLSSWGLTPKDMFFIIKIYSSIYKPSTVIIASNYLDFQSTDKEFDHKELTNYLKGPPTEFSDFFINFSASYYFTNFVYHKYTTSDNNFYESLIYDKYGGISFDPSKFKIDREIWNKIDISNLREASYYYLDRISFFCRQNKIRLLFFQTPIREGIYKNLSKDWLLKHISRVKAIVLKNNHTFIDANDRFWPDSLYIDAVHFNATGARKFTKYCFDKINK
jgi:hypothetical protein